MLSTALMRSDMEHRSEAVVDPLTGMLNRKALAARIAELTQQARVSGEPIGVIVGDVDHFKAINDEHGHSTGDAVLRDVAYVLRKQLRAFDLVLPARRRGVPGAAARFRPGARPSAAPSGCGQAVAAVSMAAGVKLTMSFGVSASPPQGEFDYDAVFAAADAALYEAKRGGRDQVVAEPKEGRAGRLASGVWLEDRGGGRVVAAAARCCAGSVDRARRRGERSARGPEGLAAASGVHRPAAGIREGAPPASRRALLQLGESSRAARAARRVRSRLRGGRQRRLRRLRRRLVAHEAVRDHAAAGSGAITYRIDSRRPARGTSTP